MLLYSMFKFQCSQFDIFVMENNKECNTLHEKCPNTKFFWSMFSCIRIEYGDLLRKSPHSVQIKEDTDHKKLRI